MIISGLGVPNGHHHGSHGISDAEYSDNPTINLTEVSDAKISTGQEGHQIIFGAQRDSEARRGNNREITGHAQEKSDRSHKWDHKQRSGDERGMKAINQNPAKQAT